MSTYHAQVKRGDKYWVIYVPEVDRYTQARHVREIETMARDLVAVMVEAEPDSFDLEVSITLPQEQQAHVDAARRLRQEADELSRRATEEARAAARELAAEMPLRDVAVVLDVSYQRVHQLVHA